jgi:hydroxymethylcytosylglucuronate/cytosylglucuronate synthase
MSDQSTFSLLVAIRYFGWGPVGKVRLILEKLPQARLALYGDARTISLTTKLLGSRHKFIEHPPQRSDVALVIHDRPAVKSIADLGVPVVYVDSLPYMRVTDADTPALDKVACYCAQKYPVERLPLASPLLQRWPGIKWVDPIVPPSQSRRGGRGIVIHVGGLRNYVIPRVDGELVDSAVEAYLNLVLFPLVGVLHAAGRKVSAVCGNLSPDSCRRLRALLPECDAIGPQTPYAFERMLSDADLLITSPGSTTILHAMAISLPTLLLPPQNLSQILNARLYSKPGADTMQWPASVLGGGAKIEQLRSQGLNAALPYIYQSIANAAASQEVANEVATVIRTAINNAPDDGVLHDCLPALGARGAAQVAQLITQTRSASHNPPYRTKSR